MVINDFNGSGFPIFPYPLNDQDLLFGGIEGKGKWERSGKPSGFFPVGKWRTNGQGNIFAGGIIDPNVEVRLIRDDLRGSGLSFPEYIGGGIIVVRKYVPQNLHFPFIRFGFKNIEAAQTFPGLIGETNEYPITDQEKVISQYFGEPPGP